MTHKLSKMNNGVFVRHVEVGESLSDALNRDDIKESYKKALNKIKNILQK